MVRGKTLPATGGRKEREMAEHWWERPTNFVIGFVRRRLEKQYEHKLLEFAVKYPSIRHIYEELGKDITLDLVGGIIENFPDPKDTKTVKGNLLAALKYFALITPRELGRIFDEGRDLGAGPGVPRVTPATPAQVGALIAQIALLDDQAEFLVWLEDLNPRDRAFFWGEVAKWQPAEQLAFIRDYDAIERGIVIKQFVPAPPPLSQQHRSPREAEADLRSRWQRCEFLWDEINRLLGESDRIRHSDHARAGRLEIEAAAREEEIRSLASTLPVLQAEVLRMRQGVRPFADTMPRTNAALRALATKLGVPQEPNP